MANPNDGGDQPAPDQNTPDQTTPDQQNQTVIGLLTTMQQEMNDDRTTMRKFMGDVTRQLADPLAPIESFWVNLRNPSSDSVAGQKRFIHIGVNPHVEEGNDPEQYSERGLNEMSPERKRRYLAFIGSRINVAPGVPPQMPGGEGASASSQNDIAALMHTRDTRNLELEEELRQALARLSSNTSATQSNTDQATGTQIRPSAASGQVSSAPPAVSRSPVEDTTSQKFGPGISGKGEGPAIVGSDRPQLGLAEGEGHDAVPVNDASTDIPPGAEDAQPPRPLPKQTGATTEADESAAPDIDTGASKKGAANGKKIPAVGPVRASTRIKGNAQADSLNATEAKPKPGKTEKSFEYEIDTDPRRKKFPGFVNTITSPKRRDFANDDPDRPIKKARQDAKAAAAARAGSESTAVTPRSTSTQPNNRGRTQSVPLATPSISATASQVPKSTGKRKAVDYTKDDQSDDEEQPGSDDEEQPRKHRETNVLDDIGEEPESEPDASSNSSEEEDDDGPGAQIRNRRPSDDSGDGDESHNAPRARQNAGRSMRKTTKGSKSQRVKKQDRRNAPSTETRARGQQLGKKDDSDNDEIQNLKTSQQSKRPSEISEMDPADRLLEFFESDDDSPNADVPDELFDESFVDDPSTRPTNEGEDDDEEEEEEEQDLDNWEDENEAKSSDDAHRFSNRSKKIVKHNDSHRPSTGYGSRHGRSGTSWIRKLGNDGNNSEANPVKTGEKRKSNSPSQAEEPNGKFSQLHKSPHQPALKPPAGEDTRQSPEKKQKPNNAKPTPGPKNKSKQ